MLNRLRQVAGVILAVTIAVGLASCGAKNVKIGVSLGVGVANRWAKEQTYMEERAKELGAEIEVRLNQTDDPKSQLQDCIEMIDSGIDVLVLTPRDINNVKEIIEYANNHQVKIISYSRIAFNEKVDLFVGYDCNRVGQNMGQYLSEIVYKGDYILLKGDPGDYNSKLLYDGAMRYLAPMKGDINIILEQEVPNWSPDVAKKLVHDAVKANGNNVDAILAPNDKLAGACTEALIELGITKHVVITGMDTEVDAIQRIAAGKQDMTFYMNLEELAHIAIDEAYHMATNQPVNINAQFDNGIEGGVDANLITGLLITKENIDKLLIESGTYTREEIYGTP